MGARKLERLRERIEGLGSAVVAFSGGVDSTLLLYVARKALPADRVLAVTVTSALLPGRDAKRARELAQALGAPHCEVTFDALAVEKVRENGPARCYHCKREILSLLIQMASQQGLAAVIEGSNSDDSRDYRPGAKARDELGVVSPLADVGLCKDEVRSLARSVGLTNWDLPAAACLASRVPYGQPLDEATLNRVDSAEQILRGAGFGQLRVRDHSILARIEVAPGERARLIELADELSPKLKALGYTFVTVDADGYRMGGLNEALLLEEAEENEADHRR